MTLRVLFLLGYLLVSSQLRRTVEGEPISGSSQEIPILLEYDHATRSRAHNSQAAHRSSSCEDLPYGAHRSVLDLVEAWCRPVAHSFTRLQPVQAACQHVVLVGDHPQYAAQPGPHGLVVPHP